MKYDVEYRLKMSAKDYNNLKNLISETFRRGSRITQTGRGKRLYNEMIPECYREDAERIIRNCRILAPAVEDKLLTVEEVRILELLEIYCMTV